MSKFIFDAFAPPVPKSEIIDASADGCTFHLSNVGPVMCLGGILVHCIEEAEMSESEPRFVASRVEPTVPPSIAIRIGGMDAQEVFSRGVSDACSLIRGLEASWHQSNKAL